MTQISDLPVEILAEIFIHCLPQEVDEGLRAHIFSTSHTSTSVVLSKICRSWRDISLTTPRLWSTLYLNLDSSPTKSEKKFNSIVDRWIGRARLLPLSVIIGAVDNLDYRCTPLMNSIISRSAHRLCSLQILSSDDFFPKLKCVGPFPALEMVTLSWVGPPHNHTIQLFGDAPQLREIRLEDYAVDSFFVLPWHNLTTFTGEISSLDIFRLAPGLIKASGFDYLRGTLLLRP
ncbi:hypothetical protein DFH07DRAFT_240437 [Mycena maculata]|uniref:F-box domain-containing protein n=1 Tax=Mycena maculata TaxID=230809 RepID=A0AAD7JSI6_9AGAR|nr:hypothetical protein DFH07DRAFT_240437 [Mycena maculata]